jgi:hypothetical protein
MKASTQRALWIGGGVLLAGATVAAVAVAASKPASTSGTPVGPAPGGGQEFSFVQGHRYQITLVLPASVALPTALAFGNAIPFAFPGLFTVVNVNLLPPSRAVATVDATGPSQTVNLSAFPYTGATYLVTDMGLTPAPAAPPATPPVTATGPTKSVTLVPGTMIQTILSGTTLQVQAPTGGTIATRHTVGTKTDVQVNGTDTFTPAASMTLTYSWTDASGASQTTTMTINVV